jgi:hypothetical protein
VIAKAARTGEGNYQAMAWMLERKHPDRWGRRLRVDGLTFVTSRQHLGLPPLFETTRGSSPSTSCPS